MLLFRRLFLLALLPMLSACGDGSVAYREVVDVLKEINAILESVKAPQDVNPAVVELDALAARSRQAAEKVAQLVDHNPEKALAEFLTVSDDLQKQVQQLEAHRNRLLSSPELATQAAPLLKKLSGSLSPDPTKESSS